MATNKHDRIEKLLEILGSGLYEKETALKLGLLTALAGESMFMLGAPGCAKSMITRRIKEAYEKLYLTRKPFKLPTSILS